MRINPLLALTVIASTCLAAPENDTFLKKREDTPPASGLKVTLLASRIVFRDEDAITLECEILNAGEKPIDVRLTPFCNWIISEDGRIENTVSIEDACAAIHVRRMKSDRPDIAWARLSSVPLGATFLNNRKFHLKSGEFLKFPFFLKKSSDVTLIPGTYEITFVYYLDASIENPDKGLREVIETNPKRKQEISSNTLSITIQAVHPPAIDPQKR